ncbi:uncharacterized protein LOC144128989 [Amblyomma americanum]
MMFLRDTMTTRPTSGNYNREAQAATMSAQQDSSPAQQTVAESVFELEEWRLDSESQASLNDVVPVADIDVVPVMDRLQASLDSSASSQSVQSPQAFVDLCAQSQASAPPSAQSAPGKRNKRKRTAQDEELVGHVERLTQALSACDTLTTREPEDECELFALTLAKKMRRVPAERQTQLQIKLLEVFQTFE